MSKIMTLQGPNLGSIQTVQLLGRPGLGSPVLSYLNGNNAGGATLLGGNRAAGAMLLGSNRAGGAMLLGTGLGDGISDTLAANQNMILLLAAGVVGYHFYKKSKTGKGLFGAKMPKKRRKRKGRR